MLKDKLCKFLVLESQQTIKYLPFQHLINLFNILNLFIYSFIPALK